MKRANSNKDKKTSHWQSRKDNLWNLRTELSTKANGLALIDKVTGCSFGQMEPNMKDYGKKIKPVVKESLPIQMVTHMKANGKTTKPTDSVCTFITNPKPSMKGTGSTI
jgi:hypothetical protein